MPMDSESVTDVTDHPYITVTRARARAHRADKELSVTSVTPVTNFSALTPEDGGVMRYLRFKETCDG